MAWWTKSAKNVFSKFLIDLWFLNQGSMPKRSYFSNSSFSILIAIFKLF